MHLEKPPTSGLYKICKVLIPTKIVGTPALQILQALNLEFLEVPLIRKDVKLRFLRNIL